MYHIIHIIYNTAFIIQAIFEGTNKIRGKQNISTHKPLRAEKRGSKRGHHIGKSRCTEIDVWLSQESKSLFCNICYPPTEISMCYPPTNVTEIEQQPKNDDTTSKKESLK